VNLLLDTHALLWWMADDPRLDASAREAIADAGNSVHVSAVTLWEMAIKHGLGKLSLPEDFDEVLAAQGFHELPVRWEHARQNRALPWLHRDPFDRMLVAQAQVEQLTLVTTDREIRKYAVTCL
jgi:PIN domain nuclease of toxin-antitoxin system